METKDLVDVVRLETGRLERLNVDVGSQVQQGQVIAELGHGKLDNNTPGVTSSGASSPGRLGLHYAPHSSPPRNRGSECDFRSNEVAPAEVTKNLCPFTR